MDKLLSINLNIKDKMYKMISVVHKHDKFGHNFYVFYSNKQWIKTIGGNHILPIKYSRHASGHNNRMTFGPTEKRFGQFKPEEKISIDKLSEAEDLIYISLNDLSTITKFLDQTDGKRGYKDTLMIESNEYEHLTIRLMIAKHDYPMSNFKFSFKTIQSFQYDEFQIIVVIRDLWIDPKKYNREQTKELLNS